MNETYFYLFFGPLYVSKILKRKYIQLVLIIIKIKLKLKYITK